MRDRRAHPERRKLAGPRRLLATLLLALLVAAGTVARAQPAGPPVDPPPQPLVRVSVRSPVDLDRTAIEPLLALRPGDPASEAAVRRTVRNLRLSGLAAEVEVLLSQTPGGLEAIVVLHPDLQVEAVTVSGETGIDAERLTAHLEQRVGMPLREDRVLRGLYAVQDRLEAEGFRSARVQLAVDVDEATRTARVDYAVSAGSRTRIGRVIFDGLPAGVDEAAALEAVRARPGEAARHNNLRDDAERLARLLIRRGYRLATVEPVAEAPGEGADTIDLTWTIDAGPSFELVVVGAERRQLEKRDLLPFLGDAGYDEALLVQSVGLIRADYQARGYYWVEVTASEERVDDRLIVRLQIEPGERATLTRVEFEGNETFSDERLGRLMLTTPRRLLSRGSGRLVESELSEDLQNLRSFYALEGFDAARVGPPSVEATGPPGSTGSSELTLTVPIVEGPRRMIADVELYGVTVIDADRLRDELPVRPGGPFHRLLVESGIERIRTRLEEAGYRSAIVTAEIEWNDSESVARVIFRVLEADRSTADAVLVRGNRRTPTRLVRRFLGLQPGDPISNARILEVQRRLYRLGVFSRVDVEVPVTGTGAVAREVLVELEEGRTRAISYGIGYDSESGLRGLLRLSEANLGGRLINVQLDALVAERDQTFRLLARRPFLGPWPVEVRALFYDESEERPQFDVERRGLQLGLERAVGHLRGGLYWDYRIVEADPGELREESLPLESRSARVASLTPAVFWDYRDDPISPRRGWSLAVQLEQAFPAFAADAEFTKLFAQGTLLVPLRRAGEVAFSLRGGALDPRAEPVDRTRFDRFDAVPYAERFYAGGRTSHRAFARDQLGIAGETLELRTDDEPLPLGGGLLALTNLEWRFPLAGPLGGVAFVDGGNLWREIEDFDVDQVRWGAGVGLRYLSPIGPLRLEIGWNLDPEPWEDESVWFFSLGNAF